MVYKEPQIIKKFLTHEECDFLINFEMDKDSSECHWAWYEVDELEDSMLRLYPDRW